MKLAERGGFERPPLATDFASNSSNSALSGQAHTHGDTQSPGNDSPELTRLVKVWGKLPAHVQKTILTLIDAHEPQAEAAPDRPDLRVA